MIDKTGCQVARSDSADVREIVNVDKTFRMAVVDGGGQRATAWKDEGISSFISCSSGLPGNAGLFSMPVNGTTGMFGMADKLAIVAVLELRPLHSARTGPGVLGSALSSAASLDLHSSASKGRYAKFCTATHCRPSVMSKAAVQIHAVATIPALQSRAAILTAKSWFRNCH